MWAVCVEWYLTVCVSCHAGFYCTAGQRVVCPAGTFGDAAGMTSPSCSGTCPAGFVCPAGSTSATTSCPAGSFCAAGSGVPTGGCEPGFYCPDGSTSNRPNPCGGNNVFCPPSAVAPQSVGPGNFSAGGTPTTRSQQLPCPPGSYCVSGVAQPCPAGRFGSVAGMQAPECEGPCAAGYFCTGGATTPKQHECGNARFYCPAGSPGPQEVPASMKSVGGASPLTRTSVAKCPDGSYSEDGWGYCITCGAGATSTGGQPCAVCPDGTFANERGTKCLPCLTSGVSCQSGIVTVVPGFWSPAMVTTTSGQASLNLSAVATGAEFYECPPNACTVDGNQQLSCGAHRTGPLCALCEGDYVLAGDECVECNSPALSWLLLVVCVAVLVTGVTFVIRKATRHLVLPELGAAPTTVATATAAAGTQQADGKARGGKTRRNVASAAAARLASNRERDNLVVPLLKVGMTVVADACTPVHSPELLLPAFRGCWSVGVFVFVLVSGCTSTDRLQLLAGVGTDGRV